jgi:hypothetical protein
VRPEAPGRLCSSCTAANGAPLPQPLFGARDQARRHDKGKRPRGLKIRPGPGSRSLHPNTRLPSPRVRTKPPARVPPIELYYKRSSGPWSGRNSDFVVPRSIGTIGLPCSTKKSVTARPPRQEKRHQSPHPDELAKTGRGLETSISRVNEALIASNRPVRAITPTIVPSAPARGPGPGSPANAANS